MWKNILGDTKERLATALEKTSEAITEVANQHVQNLKKDPQAQPHPSKEGENDVEEDDVNGPIVRNTSTEVQSSPGKENVVFIEEEEGNANGSDPHHRRFHKDKNGSKETNKSKNKNNQLDEMWSGLQAGWTGVVGKVEEMAKTLGEAVRLDDMMIRDLRLPPDAEALRDAEVVYVTDRIVAMGHPAVGSEEISAERKLAAVGHLLRKRHPGRYMVWDLSEVDYDYAVLEDAVLPFRFPGSPAPPLGMLLKLLMSLESWLSADVRNVAVVHCLTGRGRTSIVLACLLTWIGEAGFGVGTYTNDPIKCLEYVAQCRRCPPESLTIPSQRRYAGYFANMLDGVRPHRPPLLLRRILLSVAPSYGKLQRDNSSGSGSGTMDVDGCAPYLQIFKGGKLVFTTTASTTTSVSTTSVDDTGSSEKGKGNFPTKGKSNNKRGPDKDNLVFCTVEDGPVCFHVETVLQGDVLLRCRHMTRRGQRLSMFRAAFHTGYVSTRQVLRLAKAQLDGACTDSRFPDDFFLDLIFDVAPTEAAVPNRGRAVHTKGPDGALNEAEERRRRAASPDGLQDDSRTDHYGSLLYKDNTFWDIIADRRNRLAEAEANKPTDHDSNNSNNHNNHNNKHDRLFGPTIGRRRHFPPIDGTESTLSLSSSLSQATTTSNGTAAATFDAFSIAGGTDFGLEMEDAPPPSKTPADGDDDAKRRKRRDTLMEALLAADDDEDDDDNAKVDIDVDPDGEEEEISFETNGASADTRGTEADPLNVSGPTSSPQSSQQEAPTSPSTTTSTTTATTTTTGEPDKDGQLQEPDTKTKTKEPLDLSDPLVEQEDVSQTNDSSNDNDNNNNNNDNTKKYVEEEMDDDDYDEDLEDLENFLTKKK